VTPRRPLPRRSRGFTLVELIIALTLLGLMSAVMFGSLNLASRSWDAGDAKAETTATMRLTAQFLRSQLEGQHPQRMRKVQEFPLLFTGDRDTLRYAATLPARVQGGGIWLYRLAVVPKGDGSQLVLERMIPDLAATTMPEFGEPERTVLADGIKEIRLQYFGRDPGSSAIVEPTWRDRWDDRQLLPLTLRLDVIPAKGAPWPPIFASPRESVEAGCRAWDNARQRCGAA
jgi:general secretion pathway protein J